MNSTHGKFPLGSGKGVWNGNFVLELKHWFNMLSLALPNEISSMPNGVPTEFLDWMRNAQRPYDFVNELLYTLPSPRYKYYEHQSYKKMQDKILMKTNEVTKALGFYQLNSKLQIL